MRGAEFVKRVRGSVHFLRSPRGISFDLASLQDALQAGATSVRVINLETGTHYRATISQIFSDGFPVEFVLTIAKSEGFGENMTREVATVIGLRQDWGVIDGSRTSFWYPPP